MAGMTYRLEVEKEGRLSDHGGNYKDGRDNVRAGGGGGGKEVRLQL